MFTIVIRINVLSQVQYFTILSLHCGLIKKQSNRRHQTSSQIPLWSDSARGESVLVSNPCSPGESLSWVAFRTPYLRCLQGPLGKHDVGFIDKAGTTWYVTTPPENEWATRPHVTRTVEVLTCGSWNMLADTQTHRQTCSLQYFAPLGLYTTEKSIVDFPQSVVIPGKYRGYMDCALYILFS